LPEPNGTVEQLKRNAGVNAGVSTFVHAVAQPIASTYVIIAVGHVRLEQNGVTFRQNHRPFVSQRDLHRPSGHDQIFLRARRVRLGVFTVVWRQPQLVKFDAAFTVGGKQGARCEAAIARRPTDRK